MNSENNLITSLKYLEKMTVDLTIANPAKLSFKNKCGEDIFKYKKTKFIIRSILKKLKNFSQGMSVYERNAKQRY